MTRQAPKRLLGQPGKVGLTPPAHDKLLLHSLVMPPARKEAVVQILIAEDDVISRELLRRRLTRMSHTVLEAADGQEALAILQHASVQCVVTDWMMPTIDGLELIRQIRASSFPQYIYTILLTAKTDIDDVVAGLEAGADDYLIKPFNARELQARIGIATRIIELEQRLREARDTMEVLATRDGLTGLLNRRTITQHAEAELNRAVRDGEPFSLVMLDLDHFKSINDRFGHFKGDEALRLVAGALKDAVRPYDWAGRWGGEEFLIVLPGTRSDQALSIAERIRERISATVLPLMGGKREALQASLGIATVLPDTSISLDQMLHQADQALYEAKALGRNRTQLFDGEG